MLVKLIKNDYYNRGRLLIALCTATLLDALVVHVIYSYDLGSYKNGVFGTIAGMVAGFGMFLLYISFPAMLYFLNSDFGKRYFKDQGYFTHTLPVKTSFMLFSRMVCDVINTMVAVITYLLMCAILSGDILYIKNIFDGYLRIDSSWELTAAGKVLIFILRTLLLLFGMLLIVWQYNAAYTAGHTGNGAKRIKSVVFFVLFYIAEAVILSTIIEPVGNIFDVGNMEGVKRELFLETFFIVLELIGIYCMGYITNYVFKKKLNLE